MRHLLSGRRTAHLLIVVSALSVSSLGSAQTLRATAGYGFGGEFTTNGGQTVKLEGLQLGGDFSLMKFGPVGLFASPSLLTSKGKGDVYRVMVTGRFEVPLTGFNVKAGVGFAHAVDRGAGFDTQTNFTGMIGVGIPLQTALSPLSPNLEIATYFGNHGTARGWYLGVSAGF